MIIFGKEVDYDFEKKSIVVNSREYKDSKVKANTDENTLKTIIINTYATILTRGKKVVMYMPVTLICKHI